MSCSIGKGILGDVFDAVSEGVYILDRNGVIKYWNKSAERITGFSEQQIMRTKCSDNTLRHIDAEGKELCKDSCPLAACMQDGQKRKADVFMHHKNGHRVPITVKAVPLRNRFGDCVGSIEIFCDRSERSQLVNELEQLRKENLRDELTGLGNRRFGSLVLEAALSAYKERLAASVDPEQFGILMFDIDHFKSVNDQYGHNVGDRVLRMIGLTIANSIRRMDSAARWGGEEFLIILPRTTPEVLAMVADRTRVLIERSFLGVKDEAILKVTASAGGTLVQPSDTIDSLLARADENLYACKEAGRNRCLIT